MRFVQPTMQLMYTRGDRVLVRGFRGREAVLRVWEERGRGIVLSSESGYARALAGDDDAPLVGFPLTDVQRRVEVPDAVVR